MKPPRLHPGDTIAVLAPASAPKDSSQLKTGLAYLRDLGFNVEASRPAYEPYGYLSAPDDERVRELNAYLRRPDVKALFCVRGGYGTLRILDRVDYESARTHPKLLVGYSDITALHLALYHKSGLLGLSGPLVVEWGDIEAASARAFWELVRHAATPEIVGPGGELLKAVHPGTAEGTLLGGNLTLVTKLLGTPYLPPLDGAILFLEEVGEEPYRLDGLFAQLRLAGVLDRLGGLLLGAFTESTPKHGRPTFTTDEVIDHYTRSLSCPVASGLVYGHFPTKNAIPVGVRARLEVTNTDAHLTLMESVVN